MQNTIAKDSNMEVEAGFNYTVVRKNTMRKGLSGCNSSWACRSPVLPGTKMKPHMRSFYTEVVEYCHQPTPTHPFYFTLTKAEMNELLSGPSHLVCPLAGWVLKRILKRGITCPCLGSEPVREPKSWSGSCHHADLLGCVLGLCLRTSRVSIRGRVADVEKWRHRNHSRDRRKYRTTGGADFQRQQHNEPGEARRKAHATSSGP